MSDPRYAVSPPTGRPPGHWQFPAFLAMLAAFIWLRDLVWLNDPANTLPVLVGLPLMAWLGAPWELRRAPALVLAPRWALAGLGLFVIGTLTSLCVVLTAAWCCLLWSWLAPRLDAKRRPAAAKLMVLPFLSFPWIVLEGETVGFWFRLTGTQVTGWLYQGLGLNVTAIGTQLRIDGLPVDVGAACAGLNTLQAMLMAGAALAFLWLGNTRRYWWNLLLLLLLAWLANTLRVAFVCALGLSFGVELASGLIHTYGGWLVLMIMFLVCVAAFRWQRPETAPAAAAPRRR
ncbi:MAG: archaeosortase/exosortase family protein [Lentisphaeria bacterium]